MRIPSISALPPTPLTSARRAPGLPNACRRDENIETLETGGHRLSTWTGCTRQQADHHDLRHFDTQPVDPIE
jgi:hypothetical protein